MPNRWTHKLERSPESLRAAQTRSRWFYPGVGAVIGGLASAAWGTYEMNKPGEYLAPPLHFVTLPLGIVAGALVGWMVDMAVPR